MPTSQDLNAYFVDQAWLSNSCSLQKLDIKISAFVPAGPRQNLDGRNAASTAWPKEIRDT